MGMAPDHDDHVRMRIDSVCVACSKVVRNSDLVITDCGCHYCPLCLCSVLASKKADCRSRGHGGVASYSSVSPGRKEGSNTVAETTIRRRLGEVDDELFPVQHCIQSHRRDLQLGKKKFLLYGAEISCIERVETISSVSTVLDEWSEMDAPPDEGQLRVMEAIVRFMRHPITFSSAAMTPEDVSILTPREFLGLALDDKRPIFRILRALVLEDIIVDKEQILQNPNYQRQFMGIAPAGEICIRCVREKPSYLQAMLCDQCTISFCKANLSYFIIKHE